MEYYLIADTYIINFYTSSLYDLLFLNLPVWLQNKIIFLL